MVKIYRYEIGGDYKRGPYGATDHFRLNFDGETVEKYLNFKYKLISKHDTSSDHPAIYDDCSNWTNEYYCGCVSLKDLKTWFKGFNKKLIDLGFNLVEYTVNSIEIGKKGTQCCFRLNDVLSKKNIKINLEV